MPNKERLKKHSAKDIHKKRKEILDFAHHNHMVIHPDGWDDFISNYLEFHHCVCDANRLSCPCQEAIKEVISIGHCKCRLFWRDYQTFKKEKYSEVTNG
jgi:hypothetical protein